MKRFRFGSGLETRTLNLALTAPMFTDRGLNRRVALRTAVSRLIDLRPAQAVDAMYDP